MENHSSLKTLPFFLALFVGFGFNQLPVLLAAFGALCIFPGLRSSVFAFIKNQFGPFSEHYKTHKNLFLSMLVEFPLIWAIGLLFGFLQKQIWDPSLSHAYHPLWLFAVTVAALPIIEEVLFRAEMQWFFLKTFGARWALVVTSLGFAIIHPQNFLGYVLLGYVLAVYAFKSQKLWISFIVSTCYHVCNFAFWFTSQRTPVDVQSQGKLAFSVATVAFTVSLIAYFLTRKHIDYKTVFKIEDSGAEKAPLLHQPAVHLFGFTLMLILSIAVDSKFGGSLYLEKLTGAPFSRNIGESPVPEPSMRMDFAAVTAPAYDKKSEGLISQLSLQTCEGQWKEKVFCRERLLVLTKKNPRNISREHLEKVDQWVSRQLAERELGTPTNSETAFNSEANGPPCLLKVYKRAKREFQFSNNEWISDANGERRLNEVAKTFSMPDEHGKPKYMSVVSLNITRFTALSRKQWKMEKRSPASNKVSYSEDDFRRQEAVENYSMNSGETDKEFTASSIPPEFLKGCGSTRISFINE